MRAAQYIRYGKPDVLHEVQVETPVPGHGELLVKVHGTSVNHIELDVRSGRLRIAPIARFPKGMGMDFAEEVESLGDGVSGFAVGDRVWGFLSGLLTGPIAAGAEFVVTKAARTALAPRDLDLVDAAALPMAGATALIALRDHGRVKARR